MQCLVECVRSHGLAFRSVPGEGDEAQEEIGETFRMQFGKKFGGKPPQNMQPIIERVLLQRLAPVPCLQQQVIRFASCICLTPLY